MRSGRALTRLGAGLAAPAALMLGVSARSLPEPKPLTQEEIVKKWAEGPARYLMTAKESEAVRGIKSVPELAQFMTTFWGRRDPSPGTYQNEYRRTFWQRVREANRRFLGSTVPGWKTDQGKVFILLGEPVQVEQEEGPHVQLLDEALAPALGLVANADRKAGQRGIMRWVYRRQFSKAAGPEFVIAFVRDESLDWKLSSDPSMLQPSFPGSTSGEGDDSSFGGVDSALYAQLDRNLRTIQAKAERSDVRARLDAIGAGNSDVTLTSKAMGSLINSQAEQRRGEALSKVTPDTSLLANYDMGLEQNLASNAELLLSSVTAKEFLSSFPIKPRFEFFRARGSATFVNIGALIDTRALYGALAGGLSSLRLYASVAPTDDLAHPQYVSNENQPVSFDLQKGPPPGGVVEVWTGIPLVPGRYQATFAVEDSLTGSLGRTSADLEVPDLSGTDLRFSTLVLASELSQSEGRLGVTARSSGTFNRSDSFGVYYEVYGLTTGEGGTRFDASYRFSREIDGAFHQIGRAIVISDRTEAAQGWSFPLEKWPAGTYRLEVTVSEPGGKSATASASFEVVD